MPKQREGVSSDVWSGEDMKRIGLIAILTDASSDSNKGQRHIGPAELKMLVDDIQRYSRLQDERNHLLHCGRCRKIIIEMLALRIPVPMPSVVGESTGKWISCLFSENTRGGDKAQPRQAPGKIDPTVPVKRILPIVITRMQLPVTEPNGTPMSYILEHKESGKRLTQNQTFTDANVKDGDHLIVYSETLGGPKRRPRKTGK